MRSRIASLLVAASLLPLAGCGESDSASETGKDPAALVPADAPLYVEAVIRPDGDLKTGAEEALGKILRTDDPGAKLEKLLDDASADSDVTWDSVKEWLGPRIGVYASGFADSEPQFAVVADITDADKAQEDFAKAENEENYKLEIVEDYGVFGTTETIADVKAVAEGGKPLAENEDYVEAREAVSADDDLGLLFIDPQGLLDAFAGSLEGLEGTPFEGAQALDAFRQIFAKAGRSAAVGLHADGDVIRFDGASIGAEAAEQSGDAAESVRNLPSDAWLAIGFGDLGQSLTDALAQIQQLAGAAGEGAPDFDQLFEQFQRQTGVNVREDFLSWMGAGAVYARGSSVADIGAALTIETKDPEKSTRAVGLLARGLNRAGATVQDARVEGYDVAIELRNPQVPVSLIIAANQERFSIGVNPQALAALNDPSETLGDTEKYGNAKDALGDLDPVAVIDTPTIVNLLETFGLSQVDGYAQVKPYLEAFGVLSAGSAHDGDVRRFSLAVGLR